MLIRPTKIQFPVTDLKQIRQRQVFLELDNPAKQQIQYVKLSGEHTEDFSYVLSSGKQSEQYIKVFFHPHQVGEKRAVMHVVNQQGDISAIDIEGEGIYRKLSPNTIHIQGARRRKQRMRIRRLTRLINRLKQL